MMNSRPDRLKAGGVPLAPAHILPNIGQYPPTTRSGALQIVGPAYPVGPPAAQVGQLVAHCVGLAQRPGGTPRNVGWCGRGLEGLQLICIALGGIACGEYDDCR